MYILKENISNEIIIKKSRFICFLYSVQTEEETNQILNKLKEEYKGATHYCYAYVLKNKQKYNDDKEPSGTAGLPILDVLLKNELTNTLAVVIRYFGGIKLGAGGLTRAYSNTVIETLKLTEKIQYKEYITIEVETDYENIKKLDYLLKDYEIIDKKYDDKIIYTVKVEKDKENIIKNILNEYKKV